MLGNDVIRWGLLMVAIIVAGCADNTSTQTIDTTYNTINKHPLRDTDSARHYYQLGQKHLEHDDLDRASEAFRRALNADVEFGPAHHSLGLVYYKQGRYYEAAWEFEDARKLMPRSPEPLNNLGLLHEKDGQLDRAVDYYRRAIALAPNNIEYAANLAKVLVRRGDRTDEVYALLERILEHDQRPEWLIWAQRQQALTKPLK